MLSSITAAEALASLDTFSAVIDVRSEGEFAADRIPGALNWPVLNDAERHLVGTEYKQLSAFTAQKRGAAMVMRNIALHIEREVMDRPRDWQPLVYCWRGGKRSGSLAWVLSQIGFRVRVVEGGYQAYRRAVIAALEDLPGRFDYRVVCGSTGTGKSRLLRVLQARDGTQVLDLEALANHRGSVLGLVPGTVQPSQKQFESRIWDALRRFDPALPVFVESESKKVGNLRVPAVLIDEMRKARCIRLDLPLDRRVELLLEDYDFFLADVPGFCERLNALRALRGHEAVDRWQAAARACDMPGVFRSLLLEHYDPGYAASMKRNFTGVSATHAELQWDGSEAALQIAADAAVAAG